MEVGNFTRTPGLMFTWSRRETRVGSSRTPSTSRMPLFSILRGVRGPRPTALSACPPQTHGDRSRSTYTAKIHANSILCWNTKILQLNSELYLTCFWSVIWCLINVLQENITFDVHYIIISKHVKLCFIFLGKNVTIIKQTKPGYNIFNMQRII